MPPWGSPAAGSRKQGSNGMPHEETEDSLVGEGNLSRVSRDRRCRGPGFALLNRAVKAQPSPRLQIWGRF